MLRYYCIFICLQMCFCLKQLDDTYNETPRSPSRKEKKETTKSSKLVQFDTFDFMKRNNDAVDDALEDRYIASIYDDYASLETDPKVSGIDNVDDSSILYDDIASIDDQLKSNRDLYKTSSTRVKESTAEENSDYLSAKNPVSENIQETTVNLEPKRRPFKNMKLPFFSYDEKVNTAKHQHKRKFICFNCKKKINKPSNDKPGAGKPLATSDGHYFKNMFKLGERNKRSHYLCPKCIRGLFTKSKKKITKKVKHESNITQKTKTINKNNIPNNDSLNGDYHTGIVREKRSEEDASAERERRLKELAEVERKINSIRVTAPIFTNEDVVFT